MSRPNWRNEEEYAFTETLTRDGWAWQFLSRNDDYIKDWNDLLETFLEDEENKALYERLTQNVFPVHPPSSLEAHPQYLPTMAECTEKEKKVLGTEYKVTYDLCYISCTGAGEKWGFYFNELYNPHKIEPLRHIDDIYIDYVTDPVRKSKQKLPIFFDSLPRPSTDVDPREAFETLKITIDYRKRIPQQFKEYLEYCERRQLSFERSIGKNAKESEINYKPKSWKIYLRILDGIADGKSSKEIEQFVHDVDVTERRKQAKYLVRRYRDILLPTPHKIGHST